MHVGDFYYSQATDSCWVSAQATLSIGWGYAAAIFGYGYAYAGFRLTVWDLSGSDKFSTTTVIYDESAHGIGFHPSKIITAGMYIPARADAWYAIEAAAVQRVYAWGAIADGQSKFALYVGPFTVSPLILT